MPHERWWSFERCVRALNVLLVESRRKSIIVKVLIVCRVSNKYKCDWQSSISLNFCLDLSLCRVCRSADGRPITSRGSFLLQFLLVLCLVFRFIYHNAFDGCKWCASIERADITFKLVTFFFVFNLCACAQDSSRFVFKFLSQTVSMSSAWW